MLVLAGLILLAGITTFAQLGGPLISALIVGLCIAVAVMIGGPLQHRQVAQQYNVDREALQERLGYRADLLQIMTSAEPRALIVSDRWERILYANTEAAKRAGRESEELIGMTLGTVLGDDAAKRAKERMIAALKQKRTVVEIDRDQNSMIPRVVQTSYIPIANSAHIKDAIYITETDITDLMMEREQRERMFRQLLDVCVQIADKRDPHAAGHSELVGELARNLALQLALPRDQVETSEIAGLLMNFGKVLVPQEILTKAGKLTTEELQLVRECMLSSADVLSVVQFPGPVVQTLRQVHEAVDGSGMPEGRKGDDILITARVCAVANAYIALISSRAHRAGLDFNAALDQLQKQAGHTFDKKVVDALGVYLQQSNMFGRLAKIQARAQN
ncbi:MAG: HD-GYP domain-containing protein [Bdellovibrionales bacterium]